MDQMSPSLKVWKAGMEPTKDVKETIIVPENKLAVPSPSKTCRVFHDSFFNIDSLANVNFTDFVKGNEIVTGLITMNTMSIGAD